MQAIFESLAKQQEENTKELKSLSGTVATFYKDYTDTKKKEETQKKKEANEKKRKGADNFLDKIQKDIKNKNNKGGILGALFGGMGTLFKGLSGVVLLKALGITAIVGTIAAYFKSEKFRGFVNNSILKPMGSAIVNGLGSIFSGMWDGISKWFKNRFSINIEKRTGFGGEQSGEIPLMRQKGGPIKVKGSGYGDRVPMSLPAGSFVLNKKASAYLQKGGMVPTMLEPGETVYGPGQWGSGTAALNSSVRRFQTGGMVEHDNTGSGYNPNGAKDYKGRPVVLSKAAADAFARMMNAGGVNGSDVTSSQRSSSYNKVVGGATASNHLTGNAIDIHGSSKAWMKANGQNYGWKLLDPKYTSHDGHFDYVGGASVAGNIKDKESRLPNKPKLNATTIIDYNGDGKTNAVDTNYYFKNIMGRKPNRGEVVRFKGTGDYRMFDGRGWAKYFPTTDTLGITSQNHTPGSKGQDLVNAQPTSVPVKGKGNFFERIFNAFKEGFASKMKQGSLSGLIGGMLGIESTSVADNGVSSSSYASGGGSPYVEHGKWGPVLKLIADAESGSGGYEAMFPSTTLPGATKMTIAEVARKATGAVGMWQNLPRYLNGRAIAVGLDPNTALYNEENQQKIAEYLIGPGQANVSVAQAKSDPEGTMHKLSKVWAAIPKDNGGASFYAGDGVNKAHIKPSQMYAAFQKLQKGGAVMLEPGEKVFMPGQWDQSIADMNNSIPRFQSGGVTGMRGGNPNYGLSAMNDTRSSMDMMALQPIIIQGGGGGGTPAKDSSTAPQVPTLPTQSGHSEAHYLEMILAKNIGG